MRMDADWDTSKYNNNHIAASCDFLVSQVKTTEDPSVQRVAVDMLLILMRR
jgi:hypothetical protein